MTKRTHNDNNIIGRDRVRIVPQAAMLDCGTEAANSPAQPIAVVPLLDDDRIAGFEVRCGCGASVVVECIYEQALTEPRLPEPGT